MFFTNTNSPCSVISMVCISGLNAFISFTTLVRLAALVLSNNISTNSFKKKFFSVEPLIIDINLLGSAKSNFFSCIANANNALLAAANVTRSNSGSLSKK